MLAGIWDTFAEEKTIKIFLTIKNKAHHTNKPNQPNQEENKDSGAFSP
jgi:hypothetical protein